MIAILSYCFMTPFAVSAQDGGTKLRGGVKFNGHVEAIGIGVGADMPVADLIRVGGDFNFYFPGDENIFGVGNISTTIWTINVNGYYELLTNDSMTVHGLAGINYLNFTYDNVAGCSFCNDTFTDIGLNLGGLAEFGTGNIGFFGTVQIVGLGGDSNGFVVGGGATMTL